MGEAKCIWRREGMQNCIPSLLEGIHRSRAWEKEEGRLRAEKEEEEEVRAPARRSGPAAADVSMADERRHGVAGHLRGGGTTPSFSADLTSSVTESTSTMVD
jgi:hypothetical protein